MNDSKVHAVILAGGSGTRRQEFISVDDLANARVFLATLNDERYNALVEPSRSPIVSVAMSKNQTIRELSATIADVVCYKSKFMQGTSKQTGLYARCSKTPGLWD